MDDVQNTSIGASERSTHLRKELGLVTPAELASALGVSEVTLQVWRQTALGSPSWEKISFIPCGKSSIGPN
jgi:DNA-binding transcriptional regulator YiaG